MLGNMAAGADVPLSRISDLFIQLQSGDAQDKSLIQMAEMGIPIYQELASVIGKSVDEVCLLAENGQIGLSDLQAAMGNLTASGGEFENSMREKSLSINELFNDIKGGWDNVMTSLAGQHNPLISGNMGKYVAENYKIVGEAITTLKDAHGIYKAAVAVSTTIENSAIVAKKGLLTVTTLLTAAQKGLNAAVNKNPYVLFATVILTAATAIARFTRSKKEANKETEATTKPIREEYGATQTLLEKLKDANLQEEERRRILARLRDLNPDVVKGIEDEHMAMDKLNEKIEENQRLLLLREAMQHKADDSKYSENEAKLNQAEAQIESDEAKANLMLAEFSSRLQKIKEGFKDKNQTSSLVTNLEKIIDTSDTAMEAIRGLEQMSSRQSDKKQSNTLDYLRQFIDNQKTHIEGFKNNVKTYNTASAQYIASTNQMLEAAKQLALLETADPAEREELIRKLMAPYSGEQSGTSTSTTTNKQANETTLRKRKEQQTEFNQLTKKAQEDLEKLTLDIQADGMQKRLQLSQQEYEQKEKQLKESYEKQLELYKKLGKNDPAQLRQIETTYQNSSALNKKAKAQRDQQIRQDNRKNFEQMMQEVSVPQGSQESKRIAGINQKAEDRKESASKLLDIKDITQEQYNAYVKQVEITQAAELTEGLLGQYKQYYVLREELDQEYLDKEQALLNGITAENEEAIYHALGELKKERVQAMASLDIKEFKEEVDFDDFIANMDMLSGQSLSLFREKFKKFLDEAGKDMSPDDLKGLTAIFEQLDLKITQKNPFGELKSSVEGYTQANQQLKEAREALEDADKNGTTTITVYDKELKESVQITIDKTEAEKRLKEAETERAVALQKLNTSVSGAAATMKEYMDAAGSIMGALENFGVDIPESLQGAMEGLNQTLDSLSSIDFTKPASLITGAAGVLSGVARTVSSLFNKDGRKEKEIRHLQKEVEGLQKAYENLDKAIDKAFSGDASKMINKQNELLEQQKLLIQKQIQEENKKKKTDKSKIEDWNKQLEQINEQLEENREKAKDVIFGADLQSAINDFAQAYMNAWQAGEDKATAMKDVVDNMIKGVIMEAIKGDLAGKVETLRGKILQMLDGDGMIDENEIQQLYRDMQRTTDELNKRYEKMEYLFETMDDVEPYTQQATRGGFEAMSQETAGELNGRFTALQMAGEGIKLQNTIQTGLMTEMVSGIDSLRMHTQIISLDVSEIKDISFRSVDHLAAIEKNTRFMREDLARIKTRLNNL